MYHVAYPDCHKFFALLNDSLILIALSVGLEVSDWKGCYMICCLLIKVISQLNEPQWIQSANCFLAPAPKQSASQKHGTII